MERFVWLVTVGGVALVAGLWIVRLFEGDSIARAIGVLLVALGVAGLAVGIGTEVEV